MGVQPVCDADPASAAALRCELILSVESFDRSIPLCVEVQRKNMPFNTS